jgi:hypothetical protein
MSRAQARLPLALRAEHTAASPIVLLLQYLPPLAAIALFLTYALRQLHLPGFYYDEALDLVPMLDLLQGHPPELLRGIGVGPYPIMLLDYMGSLGGYLSVPFLVLFGPGHVAARAQPIFFSCLTIGLAWLLARRWFGVQVASATVLLLAVNPSFIWFSRQGISVTSVMTVFSLGSLLLLDSAQRHLFASGRTRRAIAMAFAAGLLIGLGLWAKLLFARWAVVLVVMSLVIHWPAHCNLRGRPGHRAFGAALAAAALGAVLGALPVIYYNIVGLLRDGQPWTIALLLHSLTHPTQQFGVDNTAFFENLRKAIDDVRVFVDGSYFWYNGIPFSNTYAVPALIGGAAVGSGLAIARAGAPEARREARRFFAILAGIGTLTVLGAFTVSGLWSTHQFIMLPLPQIVVACAAVWCAALVCPGMTKQAPGARPVFVAGLASLLLALPFSRDLWVNEQHHATLARTGGSGRFSDAIYKLATWLEANRIDRPVALDWGIEKSVRVLTGNRVRPVEIFGYSDHADAAFRQRASDLLANPDQHYIVLWERFAVYNRRLDFTEIAEQKGRQVTEVFIAHEQSGLPVYVVLQAK